MGTGSLFSTPAHSFVNRPGWREFQTVLAGLRRECPPALPVVVRASWLPETILGQCLRRDKRFVVQLNRDLGEPQAVEVLCHEWAHALAWNFSLDRLTRTPEITPFEFDRFSQSLGTESAGGTRIITKKSCGSRGSRFQKGKASSTSATVRPRYLANWIGSIAASRLTSHIVRHREGSRESRRTLWRIGRTRHSIWYSACRRWSIWTRLGLSRALLSLGRTTIISVPYRWPAGQYPPHVQDPRR